MFGLRLVRLLRYENGEKRRGRGKRGRGKVFSLMFEIRVLRERKSEREQESKRKESIDKHSKEGVVLRKREEREGEEV